MQILFYFSVFVVVNFLPIYFGCFVKTTILFTTNMGKLNRNCMQQLNLYNFIRCYLLKWQGGIFSALFQLFGVEEVFLFLFLVEINDPWKEHSKDFRQLDRHWEMLFWLKIKDFPHDDSNQDNEWSFSSFFYSLNLKITWAHICVFQQNLFYR